MATLVRLIECCHVGVSDRKIKNARVCHVTSFDVLERSGGRGWRGVAWRGVAWHGMCFVVSALQLVLGHYDIYDVDTLVAILRSPHDASQVADLIDGSRALPQHGAVVGAN